MLSTIFMERNLYVQFYKHKETRILFSVAIKTLLFLYLIEIITHYTFP